MFILNNNNEAAGIISQKDKRNTFDIHLMIFVSLWLVAMGREGAISRTAAFDIA